MHVLEQLIARLHDHQIRLRRWAPRYASAAPRPFKITIPRNVADGITGDNAMAVEELCREFVSRMNAIAGVKGGE